MREIQNLTFSKIDQIITDLDLFSRILMGQYDEIIWKSTGKLFFSYNDKELSSLLRQIRDQLIPSIRGYDLNGSLGIWGTNTPIIAQKAYDIQQCLRYQISYHRHPGGGITVNFNTPYIHGDWKVKNLEEYHEILRKQRCGIYQPGHSIRTPWSCPVILDHFDDEEEKVEMIMDDPEIRTIIELSKKWAGYVREDNLFTLFTEVQDYSDGKIDQEKLRSLCELIQQKINVE